MNVQDFEWYQSEQLHEAADGLQLDRVRQEAQFKGEKHTVDSPFVDLRRERHLTRRWQTTRTQPQRCVDCAAPIPQPLYIAYYTPTQTSDVHSLFRPWFGKALFFTTWTTTAQELHLFPSLVFLWHFAGNEPIFQACSPMVLIGEFFTAHDGGNQLRIYSRGDCSAEANSGMIIELLKDMVYSYLYNHPSHS